MSAGQLICPLCLRERTCSLKFSLRDYVKHISLFHAHQPGFRLTCGIGGCKRTFENFGTFKNHLSSYHQLEVNPTNEASCNDSLFEQPGGDEQDSDPDCLMERRPTLNPISALQESSALFLLKAKEGQKLTQTALQDVIEGVTGLNQARLDIMYSAVSRVLTEAGISPASLPGLSDIFDPNGEFGRPFLGLETQYQQLKFYKTHYQFVEPVRIVLGEHRRHKGKGRKRQCVLVEDIMMYVPVLQTLQVLLQNEAIAAEIENGHKSETGYREDFCDGKEFSSHPLFSAYVDALQLFFYYDDVEVCNPLGSKAKIHKLGIFYFTLGNLPPKFRSKLSTIQLIALVERPVMTSYGMNAVLQPFVDDVKKLEAGYEFQMDGVSRVFHGTVAAVSADNLGALALGGFKESCSAYRCCRQCLATHETATTEFLEHQFTLRTKESHTEHLALLEGESASDNSMEYGINRDSVLNELTYFHVCSGGLLPDIMHDILEGALQYEMKLMLQEFILREKYITLDGFNARLERFELGYMEEKDRPTPISDTTLRSESSNTLKQAAAQMWLFGRVLPLLIGDRIPEDDEHWSNYLRMMEIVDRLFCSQIEDDGAAYLQSLISDHHQEFRQLYPNKSVIPKMHFIVHMPRLMLQYGPLVRHWTMRFEAKHSYFKGLAQSMGNFINLPYSLAMRHQLLQCYYSTNQVDIPGTGLTVGPGSVVSSITLEEELSYDVTSVFEARWIKYDGILYKKDVGIIYAINEMPQVAQVLRIYVVNSDRVLFRVRMMTTQCYIQHIRSYVVNFTNSDTALLSIHDLVLPNPIHIRTIRGKQVFILPHHVNTQD